MNIPWRGLCATYVLPKKLKTKNTFSRVNQSMLCQLKKYSWWIPMKVGGVKKAGFLHEKTSETTPIKNWRETPQKNWKNPNETGVFSLGRNTPLKLTFWTQKNTHLKRTVAFQTIMFGFQPLILPVCIGYSLSAQVSIGARYLRCISR